MIINVNEFIFNIPDRFEELEEQDKDYYVNLDLIENLNELADQIKNVNTIYENKRLDYILETFDYFYIIIKNFKEVKPEVRNDAWHILYDSLFSLHSVLKKSTENFQIDQSYHQQNIFQMIIYSFVLLSEKFEDKIDQNFDYGETTKKKKTKPNLYQEFKSTSIDIIYKLLSLNLDRIFQPSHFLYSNFINIITRWIYKIIEHSTRLRLADSFTTICELITLALDRYKHSLNYCMKIVQLLQTKENIHNILSDLVAYNIKNLPHLFLLYDLLEQIKLIDINILSKDNSGPRSVSTFLVELADKCPEETFKYISDLIEFLDEESYLLRNGILEIITNVIIKRFKSPTIVKNARIKDKLLDKLEDHIHDITSYTRSKVLALWCTLLKSGAIPIDRLELITKLIISRLNDKSCYVRKNALHFLAMLLENNPCTMMAKKDILLAMDKAEKLKKSLEEKALEMIDKQPDIFSDTSLEKSNDEKSDLNEETDGEEVDDEETDVEDEMEDNKKRKLKNNNKQGNKKCKKIGVQEEVQKLLSIWCSLENSFYNFWNKNKSSLKEKLHQDNLTIPDDLPKDDINKGFEYFRNLVTNKEYEKSLVALFSLKMVYLNDKYLKLRKSDFKDDDVEDEDEEEDGDGDDYAEDDSEETNTMARKGNVYLHDLNDKLFISTMSKDTKINTKTNKQLPYELKLAKLIFNAPVIEFGNQNIDSSDEETEINHLTDIFLDNIEECTNKIRKCNVLIARFKISLSIIDSISETIPTISTMLISRNVTDIQEAIYFLTHAYKMEIENVSATIPKMLKLILTKENSVIETLIDAFTEIYLNYGGVANEKETQCILEIEHLSKMILKLNQGELICAELLLQKLYQTKKISSMHINILWEKYLTKNSRLEDNRAALIILGMLAPIEPSLILDEKNLTKIINTSLEQYCQDLRLVADTCEVLLKSIQLPQVEKMELFYKLPQNHLLFQRLRIIMVKSIANIENKYWIRMCSKIIKTIYVLAEKPDAIIVNIISQCYHRIYHLVEFSFNHEQISSSQSSQEHNLVFGRIDTVILSRFITMLGDVAVNLLIYLDLHIMKEYKIRQYIKEKKKNSQKSKQNSNTSLISKDDELITPNEDSFQEIIFNTNETVLFGNGMLSQFTQFIERIADDHNGLNYDYSLRQASCLTMAKFMILSLKYARLHRVALLDILKNTKDGNIRSNVIISFGDLLVRFPNEFEHFTPHIFQCLSDEFYPTKSNALKVLTRLILADMIKPKGNISKIAELIVDDNEQISGMAKLFFVELSKKNNYYIYYNYVLDIISNLCASMEEVKFQTMMEFLLEFLEKNKNIEAIVVKLCDRIKETTDEQIWKNLSFCLAKLQYNDKALINLKNHFSFFSNTLYCDIIHENIMTIIHNARKTGNLKQETKTLLDEFEADIKEVRNKGTKDSAEAEMDIVVEVPATNNSIRRTKRKTRK